jgi:L-ascorbate 6-phosphate lactonase
MGLMQEIRAFSVAPSQVAMWWLGQNGYIFKSPEGTLAGVDLYLTDSCAEIGRSIGLDLGRRVPVLIEPGELDVDIFACTHNHGDHTDVETIRGLRNRETCWFVGPQTTCSVFRAEGIGSERIRAAWPDCELAFGDVAIRGTFAMPTDDSDLNHMGFVLGFGKGPRVYMTGDTDWHELLASAAKHSPDVMIACINGGFNNLSAWEAADLASRIKPKMAIPCHYDMFADNAIDPGQFRAALRVRAPGVCYQELSHGQPFVFSL